MKPLIVLAEDNTPDVYLVKAALDMQDFDFDLRVFGDGEEALAYLAQIHDAGAPCPDMLLLDLNLPRCSGEDVLKAFRQSPICKAVPVIIISSSDSAADKSRVALLGIDHFFRKEADLEAFMAIGSVVGNSLRDHGTRGM